jgi:iron complex outermembrane receptor protein
LIDGLRFRDPASINGDATSFLSDLVVTNLDRVEVLRGSGSSLYGTNAVGGVLNIVTDEGGGQTHGSLLAEGGGLGFFRGRAQIAGGANANRFLYSAGVTHLNVSRGIDRQDAARNTSGQGRLLFRVTPTATLSGRIYTGTSFVQLNSSPDLIDNIPASGIINAVPLSRGELRRFETGTPLTQLNASGATFIPDANDPDNSQANRFFSGALVFAQRPTEAFGYTISYQGLVTRRTNANGPGGFGAFAQPFGGGTSRANFDGQIQTLNGRTDFRLGRFNFINAGYEFENEKFLNRSFANDLASSSTVDTSQRSNTFFAQDQLRLMEDRLQLSAGFRAILFAQHSAILAHAEFAVCWHRSASAADCLHGRWLDCISHSLIEHKTARTRRQRLSRAVAFERFASSIGDPRLRPERTIAFDAGIDQSLFDNRVRFCNVLLRACRKLSASAQSAQTIRLIASSVAFSTRAAALRAALNKRDGDAHAFPRSVYVLYLHEQRPAHAATRRQWRVAHARYSRPSVLACRHTARARTFLPQLRPRRHKQLLSADLRFANFLDASLSLRRHC